MRLCIEDHKQLMMLTPSVEQLTVVVKALLINAVRFYKVYVLYWLEFKNTNKARKKHNKIVAQQLTKEYP